MTRRSPTLSDTSARLSAVTTTKTLDQIIAELPAEQRRLLTNFTDPRQVAYVADVGATFLRLETSRQQSLREAQANVSTDNSAAVLAVTKYLRGEAIVNLVFDRARITDPKVREAMRRGGSAVSLAEYNRVVWWAWILTSRPDGMHLFGSNMKHTGWGPVNDLFQAVQRALPTAEIFRSAKNAVKMFNRTKWFENILIEKNRAIINSTIFPHLRPMDDYPSRMFVYPIMADIPYIRWGTYLEDVVGIGWDDILNEYRNWLGAQRAESNLKDRHSFEATDPNITTGAAVTQGVWAWWLKQHPEMAKRYRLPWMIRACVTERALQFPLIETIDFHRRLAAQLPWRFPVENVYERDGIVWATINKVETAIAHRAVLIQDKRGIFSTRPLETQMGSDQTVLVMDVDLPWCQSSEYGDQIKVASTGQIWEAPTSQWEFCWTDPPAEPFSQKLKRFFIILEADPISLITNLIQIQRDARQTVREVQERYCRWYDKLNHSFTAAAPQLLKLIEASDQEMQQFRLEWEAKFQAFSDKHTYGHVERVTDLCCLFLAWLAYLDSPHPDHDRFAAAMQAKLAENQQNWLQDATFDRLRQFIRELKVIGLLHDAGKVIIPEEILGATGRLTDDQVAIMKAHVEFSYLMLVAYPTLPEHVKEAIRNHHENLDGTGYPRGLGSAEWATLDLVSRFFCFKIRIIDVYDAMRGPRDYRTPKSLPRLKVLSILLDDALRGKIDGWLTARFVRFVFWLRDWLRKQPVDYLKNLQISSKMIEFLHETETPNEDLGSETEILTELERRFSHQTLPFPWDV